MARRKKDLGRLLDERLTSTFFDFIREQNGATSEEVIGAYLSGVVRAIIICRCVETRKVMVEKCIAHLLESTDVPLFGEELTQAAADALLAAAEPQGRA